MSERNRQLLLLGVLIALFVVVVGRQLLPALVGGGGPAPRQVAGSDAAGRAPDGPVEIAELRLNALKHKPAAYKPGRDPFRFAPKPQPAPPPPPPPRPQPTAPPTQRPAAPAKPPAPQPPPVQFVYLGSFGLPGREIAVFSDGQEILNAFAGDVLKKEFVVRSIGFESADIGFVNFPDAPAKRLAIGG